MIEQHERALVKLDETARSRIAPFAGTSVVGTDSASATVFATVTEGGAWLVKRLVAFNRENTAVTLAFYAVPDGETIGVRHIQVDDVSIPANSSLNLSELISGYYAAGTELRAWSSTSDRVTLMGYYEEVF